MIAPADAQQIPPQNGVERASGDDEDDAAAQVLQRQAAFPLLRRGVNDASRSEHDHCAFKARGEEGDPLVAVVKMRQQQAGR